MQNKDFSVQIRNGTVREAVAVSLKIPELKDPYPAEEYEKRLAGVPHLVLIASEADKHIGFKVGYEREGFFYSWMGGVLPRYRRYGVARLLAEEQESWALQEGYDSVTFKTRNIHKAMLCFALKRDFHIFQVDSQPEIGEHRIWLRKML